MKKLVLLIAFLAVSCSSPAPTAPPEDPKVAGWRTRAQGITIVRDDWGMPHIYGKTDADVGVRPDLRAGRRRLQPRRDELPELHGPAGRGRRRGRDLARPADEALHRSRRSEGAVPGQPRLAEEADGRLGRRPELLPRNASPGEAARRSRSSSRGWRSASARAASAATSSACRLRSSRRSMAVPRPRQLTARANRARALDVSRRADRVERLRHRAGEFRVGQGAALDQPAHVVLLPRGSADGRARRG